METRWIFLVALVTIWLPTGHCIDEESEDEAFDADCESEDKKACYHLHTASIREDSTIGTAILKAHCDVEGFEKNVNYDLAANAARMPFKINRGGVLTLNGKLDFESRIVYKFHIKVCKVNDTNARCVYLPTIINVIDVNEAPTLKEAYTTAISENEPDGTEILAVYACDFDVGEEGMLSYSIQGTKSFKINEHTGVIKKVGSVDFERSQQQKFEVKVCDVSSKPVCSSAPVIVSILDENERPILKRKIFTDSVFEHVKRGTKVMMIEAKDPDRGQYGKLTFETVGNSTELPFNLDAKSGYLSVSGDVDYEEKNFYQFAVRVCDTSKLSKCSKALVIVNVVNVNESPIPCKAAFTASVHDDARNGKMVIKAAAKDPDSGKDGELSYHLKYQIQEFKILKKSGKIIKTGYLDHTVKSMYYLTVTACDHGQPSLCTNYPVIINVVGSDPQPYPYKDIFSAEIPENAKRGTRILQVSTNETCKGGYTIKDSTLPFSISSKGVITLSKKLDYEKSKRYQFEVRKCSKVAIGVLIKVQDVNDNKPCFVPRYFTGYAYELAEDGTEIVKVEAKDVDSGLNGKIEFEIKGKAVPFTIDNNSGTIRKSGDLSYGRKRKYGFFVKACDNGRKRKCSRAKVVIHVRGEFSFCSSNRGADIAFVVDYSKKRKTNILKLKLFQKLVASYMGVSATGNNFGIVEFSTHAAVRLYLNQAPTLHKFNTIVDSSTPYVGKMTDYHDALELTRSNLFASTKGRRMYKPAAIIFMVENVNTNKFNTTTVVRQIRDAGIKILVVGIGEKIQNHSSLVEIAGSKGDVIHAGSWRDLIDENLVKNVSERACRVGSSGMLPYFNTRNYHSGYLTQPSSYSQAGFYPGYESKMRPGFYPGYANKLHQAYGLKSYRPGQEQGKFTYAPRNWYELWSRFESVPYWRRRKTWPSYGRKVVSTSKPAALPSNKPYTTKSPPNKSHTTKSPPNKPYTTKSPPNKPYTTKSPPTKIYIKTSPSKKPFTTSSPSKKPNTTNSVLKNTSSSRPTSGDSSSTTRRIITPPAMVISKDSDENKMFYDLL